MGVNQVPPTTPDYITAINNFEADKHFLKVVQDKKTGSETITLVKKNIFTRIARAWSNFCNFEKSCYNLAVITNCFGNKICDIKQLPSNKQLKYRQIIRDCINGKGFQQIKQKAQKGHQSYVEAHKGCPSMISSNGEQFYSELWQKDFYQLVLDEIKILKDADGDIERLQLKSK